MHLFLTVLIYIISLSTKQNCALTLSSFLTDHLISSKSAKFEEVMA